MRIEKDAVGELVLNDELYGVQTKRALDNFPVTDNVTDINLIMNVVRIKKACCICNYNNKAFSFEKYEAIIKACDDILDRKYDDSFVTPAIQGGAGTSINMNVNEVISNLALLNLNMELGRYDIISPNDIINKCQSTNDVIPSAIKMTLIGYIKDLIIEIKNIQKSLLDKAYEFKDIVKMARTQLQDAVPMMLGQEFNAYASMINRPLKDLNNILNDLHIINLGASACGTGINVTPYYLDNIIKYLNEVTKDNYIQADDLFDATSNVDIYSTLSGILKSLALGLSKMSNDFRLLSSGPTTGLIEINLPVRQNGSSIMPGKVNPVIPEVMNQIAFNVIGNDQTIACAVEAGQLELNAFLPIISTKLFDSILTLTKGIRTLNENCCKGITANKDHLKDDVDHSAGISTVLCPYIGYVKASEVAHEVLKEKSTVRDVVLENNILSKDKLDIILNPIDLTHPHHINK